MTGFCPACKGDVNLPDFGDPEPCPHCGVLPALTPKGPDPMPIHRAIFLAVVLAAPFGCAARVDLAAECVEAHPDRAARPDAPIGYICDAPPARGQLPGECERVPGASGAYEVLCWPAAAAPASVVSPLCNVDYSRPVLCTAPEATRCWARFACERVPEDDPNELRPGVSCGTDSSGSIVCLWENTAP